MAYKVTFLLDKNNNWIESYISNLCTEISPHKYEVAITHNHDLVEHQDIVFILGYTRVLNAEFLAKNRFNLVVHESDLPRGKGFSPVQWQILEGSNSIPICLFEATSELDSGDIVLMDKFELTGYELYDEIREKQASATTKLITKFLFEYPIFSRLKQVGQQTFYSRRSLIDGKLDINKNIKEQFNLLRVANNENWPSFFIIDGKKYFLKIYAE
ncbi:formyltransferase family protein [Polynucleobacter sp. AM-7D1]|uniref:formyltransferase family protein n=1 Tax=Polynucleobacter sp. AM-7D1 TaxID=2689102 RepID=UPI001BFDB23C|nr:formyltransferase family protein [Polynucleobacter sp. AM-7D1]QWE28989.1 methionyl-tRNA formyltransferase [Polynucleobacter sp. AM-7D1]